MNAIYSEDQVAHILNVYRSIFPSISPELADYWGLNRQRTWSCLTTNFHQATYEKLHALHLQAQEIDGMDLDFQKKGDALRDAALGLDVGYSIGITPWTDHLLSQTYSDDKNSVVILLGHDWYPIVPDGRPSGTPLGASDSLHHVESYWPAAPEAVLEGDTVGFFFNLYPDYRPPGDPKCGRLTQYGYTYAQCLAGVDAMVDALSKRFEHIQLISWGSNVWDALLCRVAGAAPKTLLSKHIGSAPGMVQTIELAGRRLRYLPLMHPGHWGNFGRPYHLRHVKAGFAELDLGLPGMSASTRNKVQIARQIALSGGTAA